MTASMPPTAEPRRPRRWLWIALLASLAINLMVLGVVAGAGLSWRYAAAAHGGFGPSLLGFVRQLPAERRTVIRRLTSAQREQVAPLRREARLARKEAARALLAEPFDKEAFRLANNRVNAVEARIRDSGVDLIIEVAAAMTAAERREFLSWRSMRARHGGRPPRPDDDAGEEAAPKQ